MRRCGAKKITAKILSDMNDEQISLRDTLASLKVELTSTKDSLLQYLDFLTQLEETFLAIDQVLDWFERWLQDLEFSYTLLAMKKLPPQLFPPEQLAEVLKQVAEQLPSGWALVTGPKDIWSVYQDARVLVAVAHGQLRLFIKIKLMYNPLDFLMYQVVNLPSATINGTHKTMYAKLPQYLAVSVDRQHFMELSSEDLWDCDLSTRKICHLHQGINKRYPKQTCAISLFLSDKERSNENCRQVIVKNSGTHVVYLGERRWAFSGEIAKEATIHCPSTGREPTHSVVNLPAVGVLEVPSTCTAQTEEWIFPASITGSKDFEVRPVYKKPTIHLEEGTWHPREFHQNGSHSPKKILDLSRQNSTIREQLSQLLTKNKLSMMKGDLSAAEIDHLISQPSSDKEGGSMIHISVIIVTIVGVVAAANAVLLYRMWQKTQHRRRRRHPENVEGAENMPMAMIETDRVSQGGVRGSQARIPDRIPVQGE